MVNYFLDLLLYLLYVSLEIYLAMPNDLEKLTQDEKLRKKYEEAVKAAEEAILKAGPKINLENYQSIQKHFEAANKIAYEAYQDTYKANNEKSEKAYSEYQEIREKNNKNSEEASAKVSTGELTHEQYLDIKKKNDELNEQAYLDYVNAKKANDKASQEAFELYQNIFKENTKKMGATQEIYDKQNPNTSKPLTSVVQSPEVEKMVSSFKEHFKNDEWYKNNEPKVENGKIHMPFKSDKDAVEFAKKMAESGTNFVMVDKETNKVLAFSQGGKLYQMKDGKPQEFTEPLRPSKEDMEKLPTLEQFQTAPPSIPKPTTKENEFSLSPPTSSNPIGSLPETTIESTKEESVELDTVKEHTSGLGNT